ncbi:rhodanese-like domain-containing protein [Aciditerrimonas ferrireducens]|uniref:rhodanese-like domain-containing protein n=1 Tax=Aciditerrimonas ferrireducens TaxID=667306 RepID=UPI002004F118|nr:rhodanese-like domain-containing protein [Aciditerrimonas ferrireducens]MCK4177755.1 rhodanese-like domain-containing protein [Aciditerrimonas ferrireducens]
MAEEIDVRTLAALTETEEPFILDVRRPEEYVEAHVPGARLVPLDELPARLQELPSERPLVVICASGGRSLQAADWLAAHGREAVSVAGGTRAWAEVGLPVHRGSGCCSG